MPALTKPKLFQPVKVGAIDLNHRVVLAPLTRLRTTGGANPALIIPLAKEYYAQRASAPGTLLITEGTLVSAKSGTLPYFPGAWAEEQISAWKEVVSAVHEKGSSIFLQIAAVGRMAGQPIPGLVKDPDSDFEIVSASNIPVKLAADAGAAAPRPLTKDEIVAYAEDFANAAYDLITKAGFDGIELHGANGTLVDQFIQDVSNQRTDEYGGSIENRSRFALEMLEAITKRIGQEKTALRLAPWNRSGDMGMDSPIPQFAHLVSEVKRRFPELAYLSIIESRYDAMGPSIPGSNDFIRAIWSPKVLISAGGYTPESALEAAEKASASGSTELVAFGRHFIANPDLVRRLEEDLPLNPYDRATFYLPGDYPAGYTDYPFAK